LFILFFGPGIGVHAQSGEDELFSTAQRAFEDGFHDVAARYLEEFHSQYPQSPKTGQTKLLLGQCYFLKNDFNKALNVFQSIGDTPENKDALLFWMGETRLKLSDDARARGSYEQLLGFFPGSVYVPQALYSLGWSYFNRKEYLPAKNIFQKLTARHPKHPLAEDGFLKIAQCAYNMGDYSAAAGEFEQYSTRYPQGARGTEAHLNIADAYYYMGDFTRSMAAYEKVIKTAQDPQLLQAAYTGRIWCAVKKRAFDQAQKLAKEALEFFKSKGIPAEDLLLVTGQLSYEKGDWEGAAGAYSDMIRDFPSGTRRLEAHLGRANAYYALRKFTEAADDFRFILDHGRPDADAELIQKANLGLGWVYTKLDAFEAAVKCFQYAYEHAARPEDKANALAQMGDAYQDAGKFNEAIGIYDDVLKNYTDSSLVDYVQYRQGIAFLKSEKIESTLAAFQQLQDRFPNSTYLEDINYYLGVAQFKKGGWPAAAGRMEAFLKALTHPSEYAPQANYILALSYLNLKQSEDALKIFQKILRLYPDNDTVAKNSDIGIAKCQFELGQVKEAVKRFKLIIYKYPKTAVEQEALLWLAQYAMKNSQYDRAVDYYTQILDRFSGSVLADQVHYELGQAYEALGALDMALAQYKAVSPKDPLMSSKVKLAIAGIFSKEFDPQKALDAYWNIAATNPE
ncbi:MAG: tetratricopeptide repeat protein, partial [Candidatus Omnitrophica bacterium]|nr:tetratricopeptide repeat protein [Candidatus Omnitrophota bacterium]